MLADLATSLMSVDSTSGSEARVITLADGILREKRWHTTRIHVSDGRDAILATLVPPASAQPFVTLSTHLDTVPPFIAPTRDGDVIRGRGACDAKGIAAAMIVAADALRAKDVPIAMLFVVGEETCHDGAHAANEWITASGARSLALVNGEPTENTLAVGTKGAMRFTLRTTGVPAHSAYPHLGRSATMDLVKILAELDDVKVPSDSVLGPTTINLAALAGGVADNIIAPWAEARLMARLVGRDDVFEKIMRDWIGDRAEFTRGITVPPVKLDTLEGFETSVAAFATDIPSLTNWGTPYLYGPGSVHVAHKDEEFVLLSDLERAVVDYQRIVERILAR